jgi:hypothetical protein
MDELATVRRKVNGPPAQSQRAFSDNTLVLCADVLEGSISGGEEIPPLSLPGRCRCNGHIGTAHDCTTLMGYLSYRSLASW